jgi:hypothetical protein
MRVYLLALALFITFGSTAQTKIGGIVMPNVSKAGEEYLKMNGGGIREKFFIDLYVCVLYLREKSTDASKIVNGDEPMSIKIRVISGMVDNTNFEEALREGFDKSTKNNISPIKDRMETLIKEGFKEDIKTGDIYDLIYMPGSGCILQKNNKPVVTIEGLDFKKALFGIWLGDDPADAGLKTKLLGS